MAYDAKLGFSFYQPTRVLFGDGSVGELGPLCKRLGIERAMVVTDRVMRERTDVVARVERALGTRMGAIYDGVIPDTGVAVIDDGARIAKEQGCDGLVSVGGGSAIDTAKGMALVMTEGGSIRDHHGSAHLQRRQTAHVAVPTTAGTGSEVSMYMVVKDERAHEKMHYVDDRLIPDAAVLDPEATLDMPAQLTAATGIDALTHAIEAYTSQNKNPIADGLALQAMRLIARHLPRAVAEPADKVARGQMLVAANIAGLAFNSTGVGLVHAMAHVVGARHGVHHGTANAICLPHVIRFNSDELGGCYRDVAEALGIDARDLGDEMAGEAAAQAVAQLVARIKLPGRLRDVGVPEADLDQCAAHSLADGALVQNGKFAGDKQLVLGVYKNAY
ncbi:MAG TPA: iron-containing alcohol dehydrogenase [Polyangia bacterium]|nr:iron-containing alcohol dehydrogenase [Polyangia bacterium]